ncbi:MAG: signal peptidase I [Thermoleophilia bacterium]|nr:signal peptidase I [Thermoleophilia bacterium]
MLDRTLKAAGRASLLLSVLLFTGFALLPQLGLYRTVTVLSNSMEPTFGAGDMLVLTPKALRDLRRGDVIAYAVPVGDNHVVTHRVTRVVESGDNPVVVTKGDANAQADPWQARLDGDVAWAHRLTVPYAGHALLFLRSPALRNVALYLAPALLALVWLVRIWNPRSGRKEADVRPA